MQISRHWRLNAQRYRLEGVRYDDGEVALQERPVTEAQRERRVELSQVRGAYPNEEKIIAADAAR